MDYEAIILQLQAAGELARRQGFQEEDRLLRRRWMVMEEVSEELRACLTARAKEEKER